MIRGISHLALRVADVAAAEKYYCALLGLEVGFRDTVIDQEQVSLRPGMTWEEAALEGVVPGLSALFRDGLMLALDQAPDPGQGQIDHLGLDVDEQELSTIKGNLARQECTLIAERADLLMFRDRFGVRWELTTKRYPSPVDQSTGARLGRWYPE